MEQEKIKINIWRKFSLKSFFRYFLFLFSFTLIANTLFDINHWQEIFSIGKFLIRVILAAILGFLLTVLYVPDNLKLKK